MTDFLRQFAADGQLSFKQTHNEMTDPAEHAGLQEVNECDMGALPRIRPIPPNKTEEVQNPSGWSLDPEKCQQNDVQTT